MSTCKAYNQTFIATLTTENVFVESIPGTEDWPAQHPLFLFPYP